MNTVINEDYSQKLTITLGELRMALAGLGALQAANVINSLVPAESSQLSVPGNAETRPFSSDRSLGSTSPGLSLDQ
jgi:hypothetical protein